MIKSSKDKIVNLLILLALGALLFTPVGFQFKVLVNKIFSFNPTQLEKENSVTLTNYNWQLTDANGDIANLLDFKNKVVVINIWATWCPPCVAEMPEFQKLYSDYKNKVSFLFIAQDQKIKVDNFLAKKGFDLPVYYENSKTPKALESKSIPKTFIISKNGQLVIAETGVANWNGTVTRNLLDKLIAED